MAKSTYSGPPLQKSTKIGPKIHQNCSQNLPKLVPNSSLGGVLGRSWKMLPFYSHFSPFFRPPGGILERTWDPSWPKLGQLGSEFGQVGPKMPPGGAKLAQVGAKVAQVRARMDPRWPSRWFFYRFQRMSKFLSIFQPIWNRFFMIFWCLGTSILVILYYVLQCFFKESPFSIFSYKCWNFVDFWTQQDPQNPSKIEDLRAKLA